MNIDISELAEVAAELSRFRETIPHQEAAYVAWVERQRNALRETLRRLEALLSEGSWAERLRPLTSGDSRYVIRFAGEPGSHAYGDTLAAAIDAAWAMREEDGGVK